MMGALSQPTLLSVVFPKSSDDMGDLQDLKDRDDQAVGTQMGSGSILFMRDVPTSAEVSRYNKVSPHAVYLSHV